MKKLTALLAAFVLLLAGFASASSLDSLKTTFKLGPFQIKELGFVLKQSAKTVETISGLYNLISVDRTGKTDTDTVSMLAEQMKASGETVETYQNSQGLDGLFYIQTVGGSKLLTIMMVHGNDCLVAVLSQSPDIDVSSSYVHHIMDDYSLAP